jgi:hypothetical protein
MEKGLYLDKKTTTNNKFVLFDLGHFYLQTQRSALDSWFCFVTIRIVIDRTNENHQQMGGITTGSHLH